ncbi:hypothetical protein L6452_40526 [Arctium lappa]|uniref:Uncharacterized protein n=1 Tax=Arctium lappa TaxID=4217 RepID=A0ACB8XMQ4_ARCLA|nr:hypothetical protein L6452_40526 [Arctium lappa]
MSEYDTRRCHQHQVKQEALKDDHDAFTVVIGVRASVVDGQAEADTNVKDITCAVDNFLVSTQEKELFRNPSVKISHGKRMRGLQARKSNVDVGIDMGTRVPIVGPIELENPHF